MDRRFLTVLGVSLVFALVVSSIFYQMTAKAGNAGAAKKPEKTDMRDVVVAARPLGVGVPIKPGDVKLVKMPAEQFPKGGFSKAEEVMDRPIISNVLLDEPVLEARLATRGSGQMITPLIPVGMRAVTVRVNEVSGVSGFILPGMRVDVLVTGRPPDGGSTVTSTVLQNIQVLSAGTSIQPDSRGQAINAPTVSLLVTPEQAETMTLAGNEGRIQLILRNGSDQGVEKTPGRDLSELFGGMRNRAKNKPQTDGEPEVKPRPKPRPVQAQAPVQMAAAPVVALPPVPAPPPPPDEIVEFRGTVKSVEIIGKRKN